MRQEAKAAIYKKMYGEMKSNLNVRNLKYPQERKNYEFSCRVKGVHFSFNLRADADMLILRSRNKLPGVSDDQLYDMGSRIAADSPYMFSGYDEMLILQSTIPLTGMADEAAEKKIHDATLAFVEFLSDHSDVLGKKHKDSGEELKAAKEKKADDEEKAAEETSNSRMDDNDHAEFRSEPKMPEEIIVPGPDDTAEEMQKEPETSVQKKVVSDTDMSGLFQQMEQASGVQGGKVSAGTHKKSKNVGFGKIPKMHKPVRPAEKAEAPARADKKHFAEAPQERPAETAPAPSTKAVNVQDKTAPAANAAKDTNATRAADATIPENVVSGQEAADRAPEVMRQMTELYAEVDRVFETRKKQADYREETLNQMMVQIERREKALEEKKAADEAAFIARKAELEDAQVQYDINQKDIEFQWKKLNEEKEIIKAREAGVEERASFLEKMKAESIGPDPADTATIEEYENTIKEQKEEIEKLTASLQEEADKNSIIEELQAQVQSLEQQQAEWEKASDKYENDVSEMTDSMNEQMEALAEKCEALEARNAEYETIINEYKANEAENGDMLDALKTLRTAKQACEDTIADLKTENEKLQVELSVLHSVKPQTESEKDVKAEAAKIQDELKTIGLSVEVAPAEGQLLLKGVAPDGSRIFVNVDYGIMYVEKDVKRGFKYQKESGAWNQEDIRKSYTLEDKKVICKCVYNKDIAVDATDIIGRMTNLR